MQIACLDLEGVFFGEIWINFSKNTGIEELKLTTRDVPDYDALMRRRLRILKEKQLGLADIQAVIAQMEPLEGALDFITWLRERFQVVILSDTFYEFAAPLMKKLGYPTLLCNYLVIDANGFVADYKLRQPDQKRKCVQAFHSLNYRVIAAGDSYNDLTMLNEADAGILFCPPDNVVAEYPQYPVTRNYGELQEAFLQARDGHLASSSRLPHPGTAGGMG
ncbi:MAG: bifunctional phosphoserine phosphatase/homoserine phosphotransferase ThrH [Anaerolineae bacterium]|nr:bifunctional phosphoserine phosphatase/homoserine phosphotransferase ThrH [Anaerolineae bacterium]